jgi:hypothetical protein
MVVSTVDMIVPLIAPTTASLRLAELSFRTASPTRKLTPNNHGSDSRQCSRLAF